jgi:hypothetical protein
VIAESLGGFVNNIEYSCAVDSRVILLIFPTVRAGARGVMSAESVLLIVFENADCVTQCRLNCVAKCFQERAMTKPSTLMSIRNTGKVLLEYFATTSTRYKLYDLPVIYQLAMIQGIYNENSLNHNKPLIVVSNPFLFVNCVLETFPGVWIRQFKSITFDHIVANSVHSIQQNLRHLLDSKFGQNTSWSTVVTCLEYDPLDKCCKRYDVELNESATLLDGILLYQEYTSLHELILCAAFESPCEMSSYFD